MPTKSVARVIGSLTLTLLVASTSALAASVRIAELDPQQRSVQNPSPIVLAMGAAQDDLAVIDLRQTGLPATAVDFRVERDQRLRLEVRDLDGRLVNTLADGLWAAGDHRLAWYHHDAAGKSVDEGLYVVRLVRADDGARIALAR